MWILALVAVFIVFLGYGVDRLGWHVLISGYNTMRKEEKARVDIKKIARLIAWMCYGIGFVFFIIVLLDVYRIDIPFEPLFLIMFIWIVILLWRMQRYDGNIYDEEGRIRPGGKKRLIPVVLVTVVLLVGMPALFLWFSQPSDVTFTNDSFVIEGVYGREVPYTDITNVALTDLPGVDRRTNGAATSSRYTGHFVLREGQKVLLFVDRSVEPVIRIDWTGKPIYINLATSEETMQLFERLQDR